MSLLLQPAIIILSLALDAPDRLLLHAISNESPWINVSSVSDFFFLHSVNTHCALIVIYVKCVYANAIIMWVVSMAYMYVLISSHRRDRTPIVLEL